MLRSGSPAAVNEARQRVSGEIPEITRPWASDRVRDSAAATGMKRTSMSQLVHYVLAVVPSSPSACDVY
jgi:hypothetical protein